MPNPTTTPIMTPATGPSNPFASPVYIVDVYGNQIIPANGLPVTLQAGTNNIGLIGIQGGGANNISDGPIVFWNNAVVGAGALSPAVGTSGYGKVRIVVKTSVADTLNVQVSPDGGATWYTLTQDNAGTPWTIATTATQLQSARDLNTFGSSNIRLVNISAATVTAGLQAAAI